ncbi:MAG: aspartate 1-decarboxylase [Ignavibacteriaceae bacterium]|nr:aspartate 1-decarboxylase [Ignavibacteriaceae bacterium]
MSLGIFDSTKLKEKVLLQREMLKSKIHRVTVTQAELYYEGSITVDKNLLEAANIVRYEKVQVLNFNNGTRLDTYTIEGPAGSGTICLNGPAARFGAVGDEIIIVSYVSIPEESIKNYMPKIVLVDKNNNITKIL